MAENSVGLGRLMSPMIYGSLRGWDERDEVATKGLMRDDEGRDGAEGEEGLVIRI